MVLTTPQQRRYRFELGIPLGSDPGNAGPGVLPAQNRSVYCEELV